MTGLDEELVQHVDQLGSAGWTSTTHRYTAARRDPLSGAGARLFGGRWNPKDIFATIYLAQPLAACLGEVERTAKSQSTTPDVLLRASYTLHEINVTNLPVLDLRDEHALAHVGLTLADISDPDWTACQAVGNAAWFLGLGGVLAPSATEEGVVLAAFEARIVGHLTVAKSEPLTPELFETLRAGTA
ncbi:RES domain-containing protein [Microbacterium horticulturae]|uniref:RES domain-containing protein n=1 Tax=Microbacterium horticulturae TaxID=3028316 RepID=A0ABY8BXI9_9MICO|nr:RES domain-containing protein [Microbacterium sp. KACC 23027]WEG08921.1 RES domain-containing protein [Microbacterium sp. KACC 23027]